MITNALTDKAAHDNDLKEGDRKLQSVISQLRDVRRGVLASIHCPYCGTYLKPVDAENNPIDWIYPNVSPWCCDYMEHAAMAIVERMMVQAKMDEFKRIQDAQDKAHTK